MDDYGVEMMKPSDYWHDFKKCTGDLTWRIATPQDVFRIEELRKHTEKITGEPQLDPNLFAMPTLIALVGQDKEGKVVECVYIEAQVELIKMTCDPGSFKEIAMLEPEFSTYLRSLGIKWVLAKTLPRHSPKMGDGLKSMGFSCIDRVFSFWRRRL